MSSAAIDINLIRADDRIRKVTPAAVAALAESIVEVGLLNPITIYPREIIRNGQPVSGYGLIAGAHRLEACKSLGLAEIECHVVEGLEDSQRIIAECDENLCVSELSPSDRALFTAKRKAAYIDLHPETAHGGDRKSSCQVGDMKSTARFTAETAAATGKSERVVQRDAGRGENIDPTALAMVRGTHLDKGTFLDMLAKAPEADQVKIVRNHLARGTAATPSKARERVDVKSDAEVVADEVADMVRRWNKLSPEARAMFLSEIDLPVMDKGAFR